MAIIGKMEEMLQDLEKFSPENLGALMNEMLHCFGMLKTQLESPDEAVRKSAVEVAALFREKLQEHLSMLCSMIGMDPKGLEAYLSDPSKFNSDEWAAIEKAKSEIDEFRQELGITSSAQPAPTPKKKKAKTKSWLPG